MGKIDTASMLSGSINNKPPSGEKLEGQNSFYKDVKISKMVDLVNHTKSAETKAAVAFLVFVAVNQMHELNTSAIAIAKSLKKSCTHNYNAIIFRLSSLLFIHIILNRQTPRLFHT